MSKKAFFALYFAAFISMLGLGIISPILPLFAEKLHASGFWVGMIFTGFVISRAVFMPFIGKISDKTGRKIYIAGGLLLYAVISVCYLYASNVYLLTLVRLAHGVASGMIIPVVMAYAGSCAKKGQEGATMGTLNMMLYLGMAAGPFFGGVVSGMLGFRAVFYGMAIVSVIGFVVTLFFLPEMKAQGSRSEQPTMPFKEIMKYNIIKMVLLVSIIITLREAVLMSFLPTLAQNVKIDASQVGIIISVGILCAGILQTPFGKLADRLKGAGKLYQIIIGSIIGTLALVALPFFSDFSMFLVLGSVIGIGAAISTPAIMSISVLAGQVSGMGMWMAILNTAMSIGFIVTPLVSGIVMDSMGINSVFYLFGCVSLAGTAICFYYMRKRLKGYKK
ncbi:MAG: MFS transporter [Candidatus Ancaeobacter aquaticus]|nr:MFS transporter [Candidatus Ancaeobacter aquaticus]